MTTLNRLPQLDHEVFLADGGIETTLIFDDGFDLPDFAAFTLLDHTEGRAALTRYFEAYTAVAARHGVGVVLETPTWRASPDWGARQGYDHARMAAVNEDGVALVGGVRDRHATPSTPIVVSGCIGPRGDGYQVTTTMGVDHAAAYHSLQAEAFARAGADLVTAITMTYSEEAAGVALAAKAVGLPAVIAFTVETDGFLPSGESLAEAIEAVDAATGAYPAYYMVNCAHTTHFDHVLDPAQPWTNRLGGIRANASKLSHAELDEAETLDAGNPEELAQHYRELRGRLPNLRVLGGCCGTSDVHVDAIAAACAVA
jgi:S-methylmethionine-dependent homocysteine/selenocysteine methylase